MNSSENIKPNIEKKEVATQEKSIDEPKNIPEVVEDNNSKAESIEQDAQKTKQVRSAIEGIKEGNSGKQEEAVGDENQYRYARGYQGKDGQPVTMEEFKRVAEEFMGKFTTKFMTKLGFRSEFDTRRKLDQYFIKKGYKVWRRRGSRVEE